MKDQKALNIPEESNGARKPMTAEEVTGVSAGNIITDTYNNTACMLTGHIWEWQQSRTRMNSEGVLIDYSYFLCSRCGKKLYEKYNRVTTKTERISEKEYITVTAN